MKRKRLSAKRLMILALVIGICGYLMFKAPILFWLIVVPVGVHGAAKFIAWLKK